MQVFVLSIGKMDFGLNGVIMTIVGNNSSFFIVNMSKCLRDDVYMFTDD